MKKGASHVDWAISMGIFLVFLLLTIIFLRPGTEPMYRGDALLGIVEKGLDKNGSFSLEKGFLIIEPQDISNGEYEVRIRNPTQKGFNPDWKANKEHLGLVNSSLGTVPSEELLYTDYDLDDEYCTIDPDQCLRDVLDIKTYLINGKKNIFWFVYSEEVNYPQQNVDIGFKSDPKVGCFGDGGCLLDAENFTYDFGVVERQAGFLPSKLSTIDGFTDTPAPDDDYDDLKKDWGMPEDKNFQIIIQQS